MRRLPTTIFRLWLHSHEEDYDSVRTYRPTSYEFPPARGRGAFEIREDGGFELHGIGPDDRSVRREGRWRLTGEDFFEVRFKGGDFPPLRLKVVSCDERCLKLTGLEQ